MDNPLVSIIIPAYNRAHLIGETLDSIIKQTYVNWECIIVDDYSTDETFLVSSKIAKTDSRIKVFKRPVNSPKGPSACRNYGFEKSTGDFINWFDSDDIMLKNKLEVDLNNITSGNYDFTISQSEFFNDSNNEILKKYWNNCLYSKDPINDFIQLKIGWSINSSLWRKTLLVKVKLHFDERLITADDYFYHIQALENGLKPFVYDKVLVMIRVHRDRLENLKVKSQYKFIVNSYLLKNKNRLNLNETTISYLNTQSIKNINNLYKNKEWIKAVKSSFKLVFILSGFKYIAYLCILFVIGTFYCLFDYGYRFLNIS